LELFLELFFEVVAGTGAGIDVIGATTALVAAAGSKAVLAVGIAVLIVAGAVPYNPDTVLGTAYMAVSAGAIIMLPAGIAVLITMLPAGIETLAPGICVPIAGACAEPVIAMISSLVSGCPAMIS